MKLQLLVGVAPMAGGWHVQRLKTWRISDEAGQSMIDDEKMQTGRESNAHQLIARRPSLQLHLRLVAVFYICTEVRS
jgi:hypothetical protein